MKDETTDAIDLLWDCYVSISDFAATVWDEEADEGVGRGFGAERDAQSWILGAIRRLTWAV